VENCRHSESAVIGASTSNRSISGVRNRGRQLLSLFYSFGTVPLGSEEISPDGVRSRQSFRAGRAPFESDGRKIAAMASMASRSALVTDLVGIAFIPISCVLHGVGFRVVRGFAAGRYWPPSSITASAARSSAGCALRTSKAVSAYCIFRSRASAARSGLSLFKRWRNV
jgi:hypothetical protein